MIEARIEFEKNGYSLSGTRFSQWATRNIKRFSLEKEKDFIIRKKESTGGRPCVDYLFTPESWEKIVFYQNTKSKYSDKMYYIYIVYCNEDYYKIGITKDLKRRLLVLGSGNPSLYLYKHKCLEKKEAFEIEAEIKKKFCDEREFFKASLLQDVLHIFTKEK